MLFNTLQFAFFFLIVYSLYLLLPHRGQNRMLLVASYIFYGAWDAMFLLLILISTYLDYICGRAIDGAPTVRRKKFFLTLSIAGNLGILGYFKYYNFFVTSLVDLLQGFGMPVQVNLMQIVLPVGVSFYTFQSMSYTIDIYRGHLKPTRSLFDFALYVAFFPQLVAGPIERAVQLLPQVLRPRHIKWPQFSEGCYLIFWGLFQKIFVADNLARLVDPVFAQTSYYDGAIVLLALYSFAFQIYCDFAGYSNIARGLGKCMVFEIMMNFYLPHFATNPRDLWKRWHISLSSWFRDYLFKPLGGYGKGKGRTLFNVMVVFFLSGLWHGAKWPVVIWGIYHGCVLVSYIGLKPFLAQVGEPKSAFLKNTWLTIRIMLFFHVWCLGLLIFRSQSLYQIKTMLEELFFNFDLNVAGLGAMFARLVFYTWLILGLEIIQFIKKDQLIVARWPASYRAVFYFVCFYLLMIFGVKGGEQFYYFQF